MVPLDRGSEDEGGRSGGLSQVPQHSAPPFGGMASSWASSEALPSFPSPVPCFLLSQVTGLTTLGGSYLWVPYSVSPWSAEAIVFTSAFLLSGT